MFLGQIIVLGVSAAIVLWIVVFYTRQDRNNPRIIFKDDHIEVLGFLKSRVIQPSEIDKISMDLMEVDSGEELPVPDIVTFRFHLKNGKLLTLKEDFNPKGVFEQIGNAIKNRVVPTLAVYQLKDLIKRNTGIQLDEYTKSYLETGNCDKLLESRRI